jgi:hypothetical protein
MDFKATSCQKRAGITMKDPYDFILWNPGSDYDKILKLSQKESKKSWSNPYSRAAKLWTAYLYNLLMLLVPLIIAVDILKLLFKW